MPVVTGPINPQGPIIEVLVGVTEPRKEVLLKHNFVVPQRIRVKAIIDTGSSFTGITQEVLDALDLRPTGRQQILTPSTGLRPFECDLYDVSVTLPHTDMDLYFLMVPVIQTDFAPEEEVKALLGRDILDHCVFFYDGPQRVFTLAF